MPMHASSNGMVSLFSEPVPLGLGGEEGFGIRGVGFGLRV